MSCCEHRHARRPPAPALCAARCCCAPPGWPPRSTALGRAGASRRASPAPRPAPPQSVLVSVFLDGGCDGLSVLAPVGDPPTAGCARRSGCATARAAPFAEDGRLRWHPSAAGLADAARRGQGLACCPRSATTTRTSRTSPRATSGRSARSTPHLRTGWLGRVLDRVGSPDNPLQGVSLDGQPRPSLATARNPVAAIDKPGGLRLLDARRVGRRRGPRRARVRRRRPRAARLARRRRGAGRAGGGVRRRRARRARAAGRGRQAGLHAAAAPTRSPQDAFPKRLAGFAAMLGAGLPIRAASIGAPGAYDTHANQARDAAEEPASSPSTRCSPSSATSRRAGSPTACSTLVWSEFGRRAQENGSGTDHGAAGIGFLIGTRAAGPDDRRVPGPGEARQGRQPARDLRLPRRSTARCAATGSASTRPRSCPARAGIGRPVMLNEARAAPSPSLALRARRAGDAARPRRRACSSRRPSSASRSRARRSSAGPAIVQLAIRGEDPHDLRLVRLGPPAAPRAARTARETLPGAVARWRGKLARAAGAVLLAARPRAPGMRAVLRVR